MKKMQSREADVMEVRKEDGGRRRGMNREEERDESPAEPVQIFKASSSISAWPAGESRWTKQVSSLTHTHTTHTHAHTLVLHHR